MRPNALVSLFLIATAALSLFACRRAGPDKAPSTADLKTFRVMIDWVPAPEYYGFYYAREQGYYEDVGLDVEILPGKGAPVVAATLAASAEIYAGTTTSDNVLRQIARGARFKKAVPLLPFNPAVIASLKAKPVTSLQQLPNITLGTNPESSVYQQLRFALSAAGLDVNQLSEYPIGWGGAVQLKAADVDAILAYTTNVVVDLELEGLEIQELFLDSLGAKTYGLVLVLAEDSSLVAAGLAPEDAQAFIDATKKGYQEGVEDIEGATAALQNAAPTLNRVKVALALKKIGRLLQEDPYPLASLDRWIKDPSISDEHRRFARELYE